MSELENFQLNFQLKLSTKFLKGKNKYNSTVE